MSCRMARPKLSAFVDGDLEAPVSRAVAAHLETCPACRADLESLRATLEALVDLPRVACPEPIASRVQERLDMERRGPGLALLFRPRWAARPLFLPSLLPACLTVLLALAGCASSKYPWPDFAVAEDAWRPANLTAPPPAVLVAR